MKKVNVDEEDAKSRLRWRTVMYCCDPDWGMQRRKRRGDLVEFEVLSCWCGLDLQRQLFTKKVYVKEQ